MRLVVVRHGHPNYVEDCLTPLGHLQARAAAERLQEEGIREIYSSPMGRARQTAEYTAKRIGIPAEDIKILDFMHEIRWGDADGGEMFAGGHPWDIVNELMAQGYDLNDPAWPEHPYFAHNLATEASRYVARETDVFLSSLGYEREGQYYRCTRATGEQYTVALFCHGGSSSAFFAHILNMTFPSVCALFHTNFTGITVLRFPREPGVLGTPSLEIANDARHIYGIEM